MKAKSLMFTVVLSVLIILSACSSPAPPDEKSPKAQGKESSQVKPEIGYTAPDFTLKDLEGNEIKLSDYKGKPVFLNFWATWCSPCRAEMPDIQAIYENKKDKVIVLAVNLTYTEKSASDAGEFVNGQGYTFPVLLDPEGIAAQKYLVRSYPTSFFINSEGVITYKKIGLMDRDEMERAVKQASE